MAITILVVDDDSLISENLEAYFEDEGFNVILTSSGEGALDVLKQLAKSPDLGIINMRLPGMNGNEVIEAIMQSYPQMQFLIHTGATDYSLPESLLAKGLQEECVLIKPVADLNTFKEKILAKVKSTN